MNFDHLSEEVHASIIKEIQAGKKIDAVKLYQNATGESLLGSKIAVETLIDQQTKNASDTNLLGLEIQSFPFHDQVLDAIFNNRKVDAMKIYMEHSGVTLLEAKKFIEDLTDQLQVEAAD